jgi:hypothetical protein
VDRKWAGSGLSGYQSCSFDFMVMRDLWGGERGIGFKVSIQEGSGRWMIVFLCLLCCSFISTSLVLKRKGFY